MKKYYFLQIMFLLFFFSCIKQPENYVINIIETSDVHGQIFPYNFVSNDTSQYSLAQVYTYVKRVRKNFQK